MEERGAFRTHFAVGLMTIAIVLAGATTIGFFLAKESPLESTYPVSVRFSDVSGLKIGAPVLLQGAHVGRVEALWLADPAPPRFPTSEWEVRLALRADDAGVRRKITSASVFTIQSESVFGNKYVNVSIADTGAELAPNALVQGVVGAGIDARAFEKLSVALENLSGAAAELKGLLAEDPAATAAGKPNIRGLVTKLDATLSNTSEASGVLKEALSTENQTKMKQTFEDLSKSAANLSNVTERMKAGMDAWAETIEKMKFWKGWFGGDEKKQVR